MCKLFNYFRIRAEILGALVNSVFLLALCVSIFIEAVERFIQTETIREVNLLLYVACTGLTINTVGLFIFGHGHGHGHSHGAPADNKVPVDLNDTNESSPIAKSHQLGKNYSADHVGINVSVQSDGSTSHLISDSIENLNATHESTSCFSCCKGEFKILKMIKKV